MEFSGIIIHYVRSYGKMNGRFLYLDRNRENANKFLIFVHGVCTYS